MATFTGIPSLTVIGDIHIENGHIGSFTDFQGATDLLPNLENVIFVSPKGSLSRFDLNAEVIHRLVSSYQEQIIPQLAARVDAAMLLFTPIGTQVYDEALAAFLAFASTLPKVITGSSTCFIDQQVGAGETTMKIASPGAMLDGLEIQITAGAFNGSTNVRVDAAAISSYTLPPDLTPVSPMIMIDTGGQWAELPILVKIPVTIPAGKLPIAYLFNPGTGKLEPLTICDVSEGSITIMGRNFEGNHGIKGSRRGEAFSVQQNGVIVGVYDPDSVPGYDTHFRADTNGWKNHNEGSVINTPSGYCAGWVQTAIWCFNQETKPPISDESYESDNQGGNFNTPNIYQDNCLAIRLQSLIQRECKKLQADAITKFKNITPKFTYYNIKRALFDTKQPQFVTMRSGEKAHTVVVFRSEGKLLDYVDPNLPNGDYGFTCTNGQIDSVNVSYYGEPDTIYDKFYFIPSEQLGGATMNENWPKFKDGSIGKSEFPSVTLLEQTNSPSLGSTAPMNEGYVKTSNTLRLAVLKNLSKEPNVGVILFQGDSDSKGTPLSPVDTTWGTFFPVELKPGKNKLGFEIDLLPSGVDASWSTGLNPRLMNGRWADSQWFNVFYLAPPTNLIAITSSQGVVLTWDSVSDAESYNIYYSISTPVVMNTLNKV
ncbi:MAG: hypothetical protein WA705_00070, partial [Candidatus Ozemobacteraceae bacterium]